MKRENLTWGLLLILLGGAFLVFQLFPDLFGGFNWTWIIIGMGIIFVVASLLSRVGGLMIPGAILTGLGFIFIWQDRTDNWDSWAYIWTLIPGFVGLGMLIGGLYDRELRQARGAGLFLIVLSLIGLAIFGGLFGLDVSILRYWPVLLIILGGYILLRALLRPGEKEKS